MLSSVFVCLFSPDAFSLYFFIGVFFVAIAITRLLRQRQLLRYLQCRYHSNTVGNVIGAK